jgi:hypothetical protein
MSDGSLEWTKILDLGYMRTKNLILRILDLNGVYNFSVNHIEQFANGLMSANMDSRNQLQLRGFAMYKVGKRVFYKKDEEQIA